MLAALQHATALVIKNNIKNDKKLNSDVINFSSRLLKAQFSEINGFQHCDYVPVRENGTWKYRLKMKPVIVPSAQIHHTGNDHWLFSFQDESSSDINVVDSMIGGSRQLSTSVEMQFFSCTADKN